MQHRDMLTGNDRKELVNMVTLTVYNALGQEVASMPKDESMDAGDREIQFNAVETLHVGDPAAGGATSLPSGVYFYRLGVVGQDGIVSYIQTRKMVVMK